MHDFVTPQETGSIGRATVPEVWQGAEGEEAAAGMVVGRT